MEADYVTKIGSTHTICQDYCLAGKQQLAEDDEMVYAFLSDGCSGKAHPKYPGSPYTDLGARLLVLSAMQYRKGLLNGGFLPEVVVSRASDTLDTLGVPTYLNALDGTLMAAATSTQSEYVTLYRAGDGVLVTRGADGTVNYEYLEYENNMPFYLSYLLDGDREKAFHEKCTKVTKHYGWRDVDKKWTTDKYEDKIERTGLLQTYVKNRFDLFLLLSDGAESFLKGLQAVDLCHVVDQLVDIKSYTGEFLKRRCNKFFTKFCTENAWTHADDFSVSGIYLK